ncbi:DUF3667 domain-containing protein [Christiangramia sabulilitoris]|uniref:DUF3667 domain-containing protein n=1 Tax=Christiangramia sabulilitoris TaxID=2583991 RepID=A0A550I8X5_9FLAO|nr:DUF3667 domain-containing protein [Christiangramia sabulilitoris]TRO67424.1 DUF3667 domain-containing protein [Christiangramia sabulilitoris]
MENTIPKSRPVADKSAYPRLTLKEIKDEICSHLYLEKGLLFTFWNMLKSPANTSNIYLYEDRKKVQNPFRYLIIAVAFATFITLSNPAFQNFISETQDANKGKYEKLEQGVGVPVWETFREAQDIYISYQNLVVLLAIPFISLFTYLVFKRKGFNFAENMALNCFIFGTIYWISGITNLFLYSLDVKILMASGWIIMTILGCYFYFRIFSINIFKAILTTIGSNVLLMITGVTFQIIVFFILLML